MDRTQEKGLFRGVVLGAALVWLLSAGSARGESALRLPMPVRFGEIRALTYNPHGRLNGRALLSMRKTPDGHVHMQVEADLNSGERSILQADLSPVDNGRALRLVLQRGWGFDRHGKLVSSMVIDHLHRRAVCTPESGVPKVVKLPQEDRIVNVPINLLLRPLVKGEADHVDFQTFVCADKVRILDTEAIVARRVRGVGGSHGFVELRYRFDMGPILSALVRPFLPKISFWFDADPPYAWAGHRMPLYSDGPVATILRSDVNPVDLKTGASRAKLTSIQREH